jgi:hypothetical protein
MPHLKTKKKTTILLCLCFEDSFVTSIGVRIQKVLKDTGAMRSFSKVISFLATAPKNVVCLAPFKVDEIHFRLLPANTIR